MTTSHAAMGATGAALVAPVAPEWAAVLAAGAIAGGTFPDLDVLLEHRKTLHFYDYYWLPAGIEALVALVDPTVWSVGGAAFFASAGLHSVADIFGGGLGLRPWVADDERGVYAHRRGEWIPPRRWIRYDGAPEDLLATGAFAVVPLLTFDGTIRLFLLAGLVVGAAYVLLRKRLPNIYERYVAP